MTGAPTPALEGVLALVMQRAKIAGLCEERPLFRRTEEKTLACMTRCRDAP